MLSEFAEVVELKPDVTDSASVSIRVFHFGNFEFVGACV